MGAFTDYTQAPDLLLDATPIIKKYYPLSGAVRTRTITNERHEIVALTEAAADSAVAAKNLLANTKAWKTKDRGPFWKCVYTIRVDGGWV